MINLNSIIKYFDLASEVRTKKATARGDGKGDEKNLHWWPQYAALVAGIAAQPYLQKYQITGQWNVEGFWGWFIFACIIGLAGLPAVYKRTFDAEKPLIIPLCTIFVAGLGWQGLIKTAGKFVGV